MPLNEYGEKLDSNGYAPSILHDKPVCLICGRYGTARHEVYFGSAYRAKSKRLGLWVTLSLCSFQFQKGKRIYYHHGLLPLQRLFRLRTQKQVFQILRRGEKQRDPNVYRICRTQKNRF